MRIISICIASIALCAAKEPARVTAGDLRGFGELSESRRELLSTALATAVEMKGLPYRFGGNGVEDGGFDCSGAIHHVLRKVGLKPPRTSADQYAWVKDHSELHGVPDTAKDTGDESFSKLRPGDLVFWTGTYEPTDGRLLKITHVAIFLGFEKKDGHPVMINATDGRSYRGERGNGFGVYDFRVPRAGGRSRLIGYGTPPGLEEG